MALLESPASAIEVAPTDLDVACAFEAVPRAEMPDPFDRIIGGTAAALGVPLVTCDKRLSTLPLVDTIW